MTGGHAVQTFAMLREFQLGTFLFSPTLEALSEADNSSSKLVELALEKTDQRLNENKTVTPSFLFAALLWPVFKMHLAESKNLGLTPQLAFENSAQFAINEQLGYTAIPRRFTLATKEIWQLQSKLAVRSKNSIEKVFCNGKFRAAYDFLLLREESGEDLKGLGQWWTKFQESNETEREKLIVSRSKSKRRFKKKRKPTHQNNLGK